MRFAAIDIGSNAVRLLIKDVNVSDANSIQQERIAYYRVPLRLGGDVFEKGKTDKRSESEKEKDRLLKAIGELKIENDFLKSALR